MLEHGSAHRMSTKERDPTIVLFDRYAFDLSQFSAAGYTPTFNVTERYLWDLANPDPEDPYVKANGGRFRAELNDRLVAPLYPLVLSLITFAVLGAPRTSRQSRGISMLMALLATTVRLIGFAAIVFAARTPEALILLYVTLGAAVVGGVVLVSRATIIEPPAFLLELVSALQERLTRRAVPA